MHLHGFKKNNKLHKGQKGQEITQETNNKLKTNKKNKSFVYKYIKRFKK